MTLKCIDDADLCEKYRPSWGPTSMQSTFAKEQKIYRIWNRIAPLPPSFWRWLRRCLYSITAARLNVSIDENLMIWSCTGCMTPVILQPSV